MLHVEMHCSPKIWERADEFLPERWTVDSGHKLYPMKGNWALFPAMRLRQTCSERDTANNSLPQGSLSNMGPATALPRA